MWYLWLIAAGIFFIIEIATVGFLIFWLGIGAIFAMITSFFTEDIIIQTTIFLITSVIFIFATRPLVNKFLQTKTVSTNVFSIIGKHGVVVNELNSVEGKGQVKINGEIWSAEELNGKTIEKGTKVVVVKIEGVKAIVSVL